MTFMFSFDKSISIKAEDLILLMRKPFELKIREINNITIFDLKGEITRILEGTTLHQHVKNHLKEGKRNFILNFDKIEFIDSFGIGELIASFKSINDTEGKLKLIKLHPRIKILFEITMLTRIFKIYDDEEEALKNFT